MSNIMRKGQAGVVMIVTLISLTILLLASVALVRSTDTSLLLAGSIGFKKDVLNQAERAVPVITKVIVSGALNTSTAKESDAVESSNYYSTMQKTSDAGIPEIMLNIGEFDKTFPNNNIVDTTSKVTIRYMVDRLCTKTGEVDPAYCALSRSTTDVGGDVHNLLACGDSSCNQRASGLDVPVYRLSIRATGPRNVETFMQYTFTQ